MSEVTHRVLADPNEGGEAVYLFSGTLIECQGFIENVSNTAWGNSHYNFREEAV